jgi:phage FluMu protein Com
MKTLKCSNCNDSLHVAYVREGKKWRRIAWACPRCGRVERAFETDFRPGRKARP